MQIQVKSLIARKAGLSMLMSGVCWMALGASDAFAQSTIYCPTNFLDLPEQQGGAFAGAGLPAGNRNSVTFSNGSCTNGPNGVGAFSGAAVAAQALSDLTQSNTQQVTRTSAAAVEQRRNEERERCDDGFVRRNGVCVRAPRVQDRRSQVKSTSANSRATPMKRAASGPSQTGAPRVAERAIVHVDEPMPVFLDAPIRYGAWAQAFGDFDRRSGAGQATLTYTAPNGGAGVVVPNTIDISARSTVKSGGFLAGLDGTKRNLFAAGDGLIAGVLLGFMDSAVNVSQALYSGNTQRMDNGSSSFRGHLTGPSLGIYGTYFQGPVSLDTTARIDLLSLDVGFDDQRAFTGACAGASSGCGGFTVPGAYTGGGYKQLVPFSGAGSTHARQLSVAQNVQYRFSLSPSLWVEPTIGYQFSRISYDSNAAVLGLADGNLLRLQGGARFGWSFITGRTVFTPTVAALLYDNVTVTGGFVQAGTFGTSAVALSDKNKLRVEGVFGLNAEHGDGWKSFTQVSIRAGENYFGIGAKGGIRYEW